MQLTQAEEKRFRVAKARNGRGIFARREFGKGEILFQVVGKKVACDDGDETPETERHNAFRYDVDTFITPAGRLGDYLNHSCEPNAKVVKRERKLFIVAARAITADEEIAIDYSTVTAADDVYEMPCNCGASSCRKVVRRYTRLPAAVGRRYLAAHMIPAYIRRIR